jgi:hypothetical protein
MVYVEPGLDESLFPMDGLEGPGFGEGLVLFEWSDADLETEPREGIESDADAWLNRTELEDPNRGELRVVVRMGEGGAVARPDSE